MACIFKRGKTWWIDYGVVAGRRIRRSLHTTSQKLAEEALVKHQGDRVRGEFIAESLTDISFDSFAKRYLELVTPTKAETSQERDHVIAKKHLIPYFDKTPIRKISKEAILEFRSMRLKTKLKRKPGTPEPFVAPSTVNREVDLLRAMLKQGEEWGYLRGVPMVPKIKTVERERRFLTPGQAGRLMEVAEGQLRSFIVVAINTGLRKNALFTLKWENVRFDQRQIRIVTKGGRIQTCEMNDWVYDTLQQHPRHISSPYVFHKADGTRWHDIRKSFGTALTKAGLPHMRFHDLKHTFVSNLILTGEDLRVVQEAAGHRDIKTTMRYAHLAPGRVKAAVNRLKWDKGEDQSAEAQSG